MSFANMSGTGGGRHPNRELDNRRNGINNTSPSRTSKTAISSNNNPEYTNNTGSPSHSSQGLVGEITSNIFNISRQVATLQDQVALLGTENDTHELREKIHDCQEGTTKMAKTTGELIKNLTAAAAPGRNSGEDHHRQMQQKKLSKDFASQLHRFEEVQKLSMRKEKTCVARARRSMKHSGSSTDSNIFSAPPHSQQSREQQILLGNHSDYQQQQQQQMMQDHVLEKDVEYNETIIAEREEAIKDIEHTIVEVNEIFKDLGTLIHDQRSIVENIESNIYSVSTHVESGHEQIGIAQNYQKKSRNKMCFCLFLLLCILLILILFLIFFKGK